jgi:HK97 family phage portal protein
MGFFSKIKEFFTKGIERKVSMSIEGRAVFPTDSYITNSREAFQKNELVYAAILEITSSLSESPIQIKDTKGEVLESHPFLDLIANPNPFTTEFELWEMTLIHMYLAGNAYWFKVRSGNGKIQEIWPLRPDRMRIVPSSKELISQYMYVLDGKEYPIDVQDILHFKFPNPTSDIYGMSPIKPALRQISTDNEATQFTKALLQNSAVPGGILTTEQPLQEHLVRRMQEQWHSKYGNNNRGTVAVVDSGLSYQAIGMNMNELSFADLRNISESRILMVLGVPPILVGAKTGLEHATYSNYKEARKSYQEETISPLQRRLSAKLEKDDDFNPENFDFSFDKSLTISFTEQQQKMIEENRLNFEKGILTREEARMALGLDPEVPEEETNPQEEENERLREENEQLREEEEKSIADFQKKAIMSFISGNISDDPAVAKYLQTLDSEVIEQKRNESDTKLIDAAIGRNTIADAYVDKFQRFAELELKKQGQQVLSLIDESNEQFGFDELNKLKQKNEELERIWIASISLSDNAAGLVGALLHLSSKNAAASLDSEVVLFPDAVDELTRSRVSKFGASFSRDSSNKVANTLVKVQEEKLTKAQTRRELRKLFRGKAAKSRAERLARTETIKIANAGAKEAFRQAGITELKWVALEDSCPYCMALNNKTVGIEESFIKSDEMFQPEGAVSPLNTSYDGSIDHPPAHPNCRCAIVPESME